MPFRRIALVVCLVMLVPALLPIGVGAAAPTGRVIVQFRAGTSADARQAARAESGVSSYVAEYPSPDAELWRVAAGTESSVIDRVAARRDVLYAEPDHLQRLPAPPSRSVGRISTYLPIGAP